MKIIFLDIDGVVNSAKYFDSELFKQQSSGRSDSQILLVDHYLHLDPDAIKLINDLVDKSGATVVLSSMWRFKYNIEEMTDMLQKRGATFIIKNKTPNIRRRMSEVVHRGDEVKAFLSSLEKQPSSFVILDDVDNMGNLKNNLVLTKYETGVTLEDIELALTILNRA